MIKLTFPDGKSKQYKKGITALEVAKSIGPRLAQDAIVAKLDNELIDLTTKINKNGKFQIFTFKEPEGRETFKHSASHILAKAAKRLFPQIKLTIGPAVEDGFYYDFDFKRAFTPEDLNKLESEMKKIIKEDIVFERLDVKKNEAKKLQKDQPYKLEMIDELGDEQCTLYKHGKFVDLCRGPHVPSTAKIKAVKLTKLAGAYWRGDAKNKQLQRVYGVAFPDKKELNQYLHLLEEAKKRDHKKLGRDLELFSFHDEAPGFPFWHPKGLHLYNTLVDYWRTEHKKEGYVEISTPIILNKTLWEKSGHWKLYKENMYLTKIDNQDYSIKPMNCPGGMLMYKERVHSYKELPLRVGELGLVHRHELSGTLNGLFRVRAFTQDDAHIFMTEKQIQSEITRLIKFTERIYKMFGFEYKIELSTRPEKSIGTDKQWETTTKALEEGIKKAGKQYYINEGDGAFYGPKIDFHIRDALNRTWQCGTIQLDMSMPERFKLTYMGEDGEDKHQPVMIHRTIYGSLERFIGILVEHYAGKFPLWLSPTQVRILPVADRFADYAYKIAKAYDAKGVRVEVDSRTESISKKVRDGQLAKANYILVVGEQEIKKGTVAIRTRDNQVIGAKKADEFLKQLLKEINEKK
ncbi:threonine--tRNA ligase [Candidatus Woesearchaeota archaeon]|nr:threonine--tRNA ligase [Candidatus Woesearchaeota archaeon]